MRRMSQHETGRGFTESFIAETIEILRAVPPGDVDAVVELIRQVRERGGRLFVCGSGGGAATGGGHGRGRRPDDDGTQPTGLSGNGRAHHPGGASTAAWPAERFDGIAPDRPGESGPIGPGQDDA